MLRHDSTCAQLVLLVVWVAPVLVLTILGAQVAVHESCGSLQHDVAHYPD